MIISKKTNAFTLSETLVALLISMLVVTCILSLYTYINGNVKKTMDNYLLNQEFVNASVFLKQNWLRAENINLTDDNGIECTSSMGIKSLYQPSVNTIIKHNNSVDTLYFTSNITDVVFVNNSLSQTTVQMQEKMHLKFLILSKRYNRDYLINHVQRHEYFTESTASE